MAPISECAFNLLPVFNLSNWGFFFQRYLKERKQFGAPLAAFQLTQQKLVHMLGNIQAMILVGWRLCKLYDSGKMTPGRVSLGKVQGFIVSCCNILRWRWCIVLMTNICFFQAWITSKARETISLGRELLGGNGILTDFLVAKVCMTSWFKLSLIPQLVWNSIFNQV